MYDFDTERNEPTMHFKDTYKRQFMRLFGYLVYRPFRRFHWWMLRGAYLTKWFKKDEFGTMMKGRTVYKWPNYFQHFMYKTVFKFEGYCQWDLWRKFAVWENGFRKEIKPLGKFIKWFGEIGHGAVCNGGRCSHCGFEKGDQVDLIDTQYFECVGTGTSWNDCGTSYDFWGWTTCPNCNTKFTYSDGSC